MQSQATSIKTTIPNFHYNENPSINAIVKDIKIIKRNGTAVEFNPNKIYIAIAKAFLDEEGDNVALSSKLKPIVDDITTDVCMALSRYKGRGSVDVEEIQDQVELALMRMAMQRKDLSKELHNVLSGYIIYREQHRKAREAKTKQAKPHNGINVTLDDGKKIPLDISELEQVVTEACQNLEYVEVKPIIDDTVKSLFDGVKAKDVRKALIMSARTLVETEPNYGQVTARLLLHDLREEVTGILGLPIPHTQKELSGYYDKCLKNSLGLGIEVKLLDPKLLSFDLDRLSKAIDPNRDFLFNYLGLQTLYDRYFLHHEEVRFELPQTFFMRVAMGLALNEDNKNERAIEFYNLISSFDYMTATPTLFNSGTTRPQLSSCFISTISDDLNGIYNSIKDNALLQKYAGGVGNDWTPVRGMNAHIKGTNGKSQGVVPFLKVVNDTAVAVNQGGKRKGSVCSYLETWHIDIEEFLELRKNTGDDRRRTHDMNTANWVPDLFMKRVLENKDWTLFSPDEAPDLHDLSGDAFEAAYVKYEKDAKLGKINNTKTIPAVSLWRKMLGMIFETGHPWITFKDSFNVRNPQQHCGVIHSTNLCTEIGLNNSADEIAVCNLGSINLPQHVNENGLDIEKLKRTVNTAIRMLDNVIDINYYSVIQARRSNLRHRPVGMGMMGFQDALYKLDISYASEEAVEFADRSMEHISYFAIEASSNLAAERGTYSSYEGSLWSKGILPIDSINLLQESRGIYLDQDRSQTLDWQKLREKVRTQGMRNSNVMAIAPTATIANICGISQSIEPTYKNLFVKSNLSGEFTVVNKYLVEDLKKLDLWDTVMINDLKYFNGSLLQIERIPENIKQKYLTAFEIDPSFIIDAASRRQKWIDQAQSLNIYIANPSGKKLDSIYRSAWLRGLKSTYYCRSLGATDAEKSTVNRSALNAVSSGNQPQPVVNACSIDDPECESCQ